MEIRDIIKKARLDRGLSMRDLAAKIGVSVGTISRWESGNIEALHPQNILSLCQTLGIPLSAFGAGKDSEIHIQKERIYEIREMAADNLEPDAAINGTIDVKDIRDIALFEVFQEIAEELSEYTENEINLVEAFRGATPEAQMAAYMTLMSNQKKGHIS